MKINANYDYSVFRKDLVIVMLIFSLPLLFYTYKLFPNVEVWDTKYFVFYSSYFKSINTFVYFLFNKLLVFFLLSIWFITCKHWWRLVILIPLSIEFYKILNIINDDVNYFDEVEFIESIPLILPLIVVLFYVSKRLNYYCKYKKLKSEINFELISLLKESSTAKSSKVIRDEFNMLKKISKKIPREDYLEKLTELKNSI